jgi:hypothetical protein
LVAGFGGIGFSGTKTEHTITLNQAFYPENFSILDISLA